MKPRGAILESPSAHLLSLVRWLLLIACAGLGQIERASAQDVAFAVKIATNTVAVNSSVTYTMNVTNRTGLSILNVVVTNRFSGPAAFQITGASTTQGTIVTNSASIAFTLGQLLDGSVAVLTTTIKPTSSGSLTNAALLAIPNSTNTTTTNVVLEVLPPSTDLAAMFVAPATPVVVGDTTTYTIGATNLGTNSVANVNLQSTGFNAFALLSLSPTNQSYTLTNGTLTMNIGTLAARAGKTFTVSAKATNAGTFALSTAVTATNITESDPSNNVVSKTLTIDPLATGDLLAENVTDMTYNPQTGLMEQTVRLTNIGTNTVSAARLIVSGLTNRLYNAIGTNNGNPFVQFNAALAPSATGSLLLEYFIPTRTAINVPNSSYTAVATSLADLSISAVGAPNITTITNLGANGILIEFVSTPNRSYTVYYSSDASFSNALTAQPSVTAPADRTQWIDNGPPKTESHPSTVGSRFYRVLLNP